MCGICGYVKLTDGATIGHRIDSMVKTLSHRGPDNQATFVQGDVALGHARLSILDLSSAGHQPMFSDDKRIAIVYNGEVYNFLEIRNELQRQGYQFTTSTDTEVIIKGFLHYGVKIFEKLNGIFAIALWDNQIQTLYLVRDRFGVKPLYYYAHKDYIIFGSEIKAILEAGIVPKTISYQSLHEFMYYGNAIGSKTLFQSINKIKAGTYLQISRNTIEEKVFWNIDDVKEIKINEQEAVASVQSLLENAVKRQLISDVPVGVFLSGGIDSSCITAFASKHYNGKISTYSCAFDFDLGVNELDKARSVANHYQTEHHELFIKGNELADVVYSLVKYHDEPFGDAADIPLYLLTQQVKDKHKVILQGDGGDELFAGYRRYNTLDNFWLWQLGSPFIKTLLSVAPSNARVEQYKRFYDAIMQKDEGLRMALLLTVETERHSPIHVFSNEIKQEVQKYDPFLVYKQYNSRFHNKDIVQRMLWTDTQILLPETFLEKVDKSTMANSVEVRVPFLDNELASFALSLPSNLKVKRGQKKYILRQAVRGIVPDHILDAPKTGFSVPFSNWLKKPLKELMLSTFNDPYIKQLKIIDEKQINIIIEEHLSNKINRGTLLWKLLNLCIWLKEYKVNLNGN